MEGHEDAADGGKFSAKDPKQNVSLGGHGRKAGSTNVIHREGGRIGVMCC